MGGNNGYWKLLRGNPAILWKRRAARREWISFAHGIEKIVFYIGCLCCGGWINLWLLQKSKTVTRFLPGFSSWKRDVFGCHNSKWLDQQFWNEVFLGYPIQNVALKFFCFSLFRFVPEKPLMEPKTTLFWKMGWTWIAGSRLDFSQVKDNSRKLWKFNGMISIRHSKKHHFEIFGRVAQEARPKTSFSRIKGPGRLPVTFWSFGNS